MGEVYLVHGDIADGMQGIPIILGIFSRFELAQQAIIKFIDGAKYEISENGDYMVEDIKRNKIYGLRISKHKLDKITPPF